MKLDLEPVIRAVVQAVLQEIEARQQKLDGDQIAFPESQAAAKLGVPRHSLRDARLRGEISGSRIGKRVVYRREELIRFLEQQHTE